MNRRNLKSPQIEGNLAEKNKTIKPRGVERAKLTLLNAYMIFKLIFPVPFKEVVTEAHA